jgi:hypothetical protein
MTTRIDLIFSNIRTILGALRVDNGYYFDWTPQSVMRDAQDWLINPKAHGINNDKDMSAMFPVVECQWDGEFAVYNGKSSQSYTTTFALRLHVYTWSDVTDYVLQNSKARSDILKAFGNDLSLSGAVENTLFTGSEVTYTQNRKSKPFSQMDMTFDLLWNFDQTDPERRC